MGLFKEIDDILVAAKLEFEELKAEYKLKRSRKSDNLFEEYDVEKYGKGNLDVNSFFWGDNLEFMKLLLSNEFAGKVQLIYIDPPFFSKAKYDANIGYKGNEFKDTAYTDCFSGGISEYIKMLAIRLFCIFELLSDTGSVWVHLDWHAAHYIKIVMDEIFGKENFVNEIIWAYKSGGSGKRSFSKKHDTLLFYSKNGNYYLDIPKEKSYNRGLSPYRFKNVKEYEDETGWYTLVNMKDVWSINMLGRTAKERTGYRTQKPEALMCRIIESCSQKGELCIDFFSGSGSFAVACEKLDRKWFASDFGDLAGAVMRKRCLGNLCDFRMVYKNNKKIRNILNISIARFEKEYIIRLDGIFGSIKDIEFWGLYEQGKNGEYLQVEYKIRNLSGELEKEIRLENITEKSKDTYYVLASDIFGKVYEERFTVGVN